MRNLLRAFGVILILGGVGHSLGIVRLYVAEGMPDANRVLLDIWIAEAQIVAGILYVAAFSAMRRGAPWRGHAIAAALIVLTYAVPFIPVLFARAPVSFRIPPAVYALLSVFIVFRAATATNADRQGRATVVVSQ